MQPFAIGAMTWVGKDAIDAVRWVAAMGMQVMHLGSPPADSFHGEKLSALQAEIARHGMTIVAIYVDWKGTRLANPETIGLANPVYREERIHKACQTADLSRELGVPCLAQHIGTIPEDTTELNTRMIYAGLVEAMRRITAYQKELGQSWLLESGPDRASTLLRFIGDVGADNLKVNLDPANLIYHAWNRGQVLNLYGEMELLREHIVSVHCKDIRLPLLQMGSTSGAFPSEVPFGQGMVDGRRFVRTLRSWGYRGPLIIEREVMDRAQQTQDVLATKAYLEELLAG